MGQGKRRRWKSGTAVAKPAVDRLWDRGQAPAPLNAVETDGVFTADELAARLHTRPAGPTGPPPRKRKAKKRTRGKAKFQQALRRMREA